MPNDKAHLTHAKHNIDFLENFYKKSEFRDWAITVSFYTSLHIIEYAIFKSGKIKYNDKDYPIIHSYQLKSAISKTLNSSHDTLSEHRVRNIIVSQNFPAIELAFRLLFEKSQIARYRRYQWSELEVNTFAKNGLKKIVKWANESFSAKLSINL